MEKEGMLKEKSLSHAQLHAFGSSHSCATTPHYSASAFSSARTHSSREGVSTPHTLFRKSSGRESFRGRVKHTEGPLDSSYWVAETVAASQGKSFTMSGCSSNNTSVVCPSEQSKKSGRGTERGNSKIPGVNRGATKVSGGGRSTKECGERRTQSCLRKNGGVT